MTHKISHADIKDWAKNYDGPLFDGILCDPPYELGFMGKSWDSTGIAYDKDMWHDLLKLVKPGGHLLAFSGSRTYHRMAVAIEDAGFEIRDMIEWVYGSGFPKSLNIGKALDGVHGKQAKGFNSAGGKENYAKQDKSFRSDYGYVYEPTTDNAKLYEGYGTALKPAHEPCVLARKPIEGTVANNVLKHGTGGLNIDGTRINYASDADKKSSKPGSLTYNADKRANIGLAGGIKGMIENNSGQWEQPPGRFPANLIHDGSDEVEAVFPSNNSGKYKDARTSRSPASFNASTGAGIAPDNYGDSGSASRFFYTAKASKSERNAGLEGFEDVLGGSLEGGNDKRNGKDEPQLKPTKNAHPTVKPLSLTKYLATLIKPPTGGRLLVPFSGSGSEMIGALQAGWEYVEGVELTEEYIPIAGARIKYWLVQKDKENEQATLL